MKNVLGVRFGHDSAACLLKDGQIVADIAEERLTRKKNDGSFPVNAIRFCLDYANTDSTELDVIAVASEYLAPDFLDFFPGLKRPAPPTRRGTGLRAMLTGGSKSHTKEKAHTGRLPLYMDRFPISDGCQLIQVEHHHAHAASAYYTSGFDLDHRTLIAVLDSMGDKSSVSLWRGEKNRIEPLLNWGVEGSLGRFYSAATEAMGWRHGSDEWKLMGLAPYGAPKPGLLDGTYPEYRDGALSKGCQFDPVSRYPDHGTFHYHMNEAQSLKERMADISREDFAFEVQKVTEDQILSLILPLLKKEGTRSLCCSGGFFLNVKVNGLIWQSGEVDEHWVFPNPGDSGLAAGAALAAYHEAHPQQQSRRLDSLYLGPEFSAEEIQRALENRHIKFSKVNNIEDTVAQLLAKNHIVGWFQGRMESGPRALGGRSILMSPLQAENKDTINKSVKYREAFRPFCPSLLEEAKEDYLLCPRNEPFMVTAFDVVPDKSSRIPAVVHVDGSLRPQTVSKRVNPRYHRLIEAFGEITGENIILNTSFNVKGEPIVCTPSEAIKCFFDTGLEYLAIGDFLVEKPGLSR